MQRLFLRARGILAQRVADDVGFVLHRDHEDLELFERGPLHHLDFLGRDLVVRLQQDLAGRLVDQVLGADPPQGSFGLLATHVEGFAVVEEIEDLAVADETERAQQHRDR